jgi:hypothetical protein
MLLSPMLRHLHSSANTGRMLPTTNRKEKLGGGKAGSSFSPCLLVEGRLNRGDIKLLWASLTLFYTPYG